MNTVAHNMRQPKEMSVSQRYHVLCMRAKRRYRQAVKRYMACSELRDEYHRASKLWDRLVTRMGREMDRKWGDRDHGLTLHEERR